MKKIFLAFADQRMSRALERIEKQALAMDAYDTILLANEHTLELEFRKQFSKYLNATTRGFGYWTWKAQIILQTLREMNDGDLLQYTDAGCHLNPRGRKRLDEYFTMTQNSATGILAFQANPPNFHNEKIDLMDLRESRWCKGDLCDALAVRSNPYIMDTQQIGATIIFIMKCNESMRIINSWLDVYKNNVNLIDDSKSNSKNLPGFVEHRHDQAVFSIVAKLNKVQTISAYEYWYPNGKNPPAPDWEILKEYPIHAKRDREIHWINEVYALPARILNKIKNRVNRMS